MWFWQNLNNSVIGVIWQQFKHRTQFVMAALCNRGAIIFLPCSFFLSIYLLSSSFFPRLISAATDWMSTILLHMAWP